MRISRASLPVLFAILAAMSFSYLLGALSYSRDWFPITTLRALKASIEERAAPPPPEEVPRGRYDKYGRLIEFEGKTAAACPPWTEDTAVILAFGQSNSANHANTLIDVSQDPRILNYFDGRCYLAGSPLLGATGAKGEFLTSLAANLLESGRFSRVILVPAGIGNSAVNAWQAGGSLNAMLLQVVDQVLGQYPVTHLVWHQGETDHRRGTEAWRYIDQFESMLTSVRDLATGTPAYVALATKCGPTPVDLASPVRLAQARIVEKHRDVHLAIDSDLALEPEDRAADECHLSAGGIRKMAAGYAQAILGNL